VQLGPDAGKLGAMNYWLMKSEPAEWLVLKRGNRLSITPVEPRHWQAIT